MVAANAFYWLGLRLGPLFSAGGGLPSLPTCVLGLLGPCQVSQAQRPPHSPRRGGRVEGRGGGLCRGASTPELQDA